MVYVCSIVSLMYVHANRIGYLSILLYFVSAIHIALLLSKQKSIGKDGMLSICCFL
jgi:hypothetical protein